MPIEYLQQAEPAFYQTPIMAPQPMQAAAETAPGLLDHVAAAIASTGHPGWVYAAAVAWPLVSIWLMMRCRDREGWSLYTGYSALRLAPVWAAGLAAPVIGLLAWMQLDGIDGEWVIGATLAGLAAMLLHVRVVWSMSLALLVSVTGMSGLIEGKHNREMAKIASEPDEPDEEGPHTAQGHG